MTETSEDDRLSRELRWIVDDLSRRFPDRDREEIGPLVEEEYRRIRAAATVTDHLVALTFRRVLDRLTGARVAGSAPPEIRPKA